MNNVLKTFSCWIADKIFDLYYPPSYIYAKGKKNNNFPKIFRDEEYFNDYFQSRDSISVSYANEEKERKKKIKKINKINLQLIEN